MKKSDYQKYLCSREWALLKEQVRKRCKGRCERCFDGKYESTHHLTYERIGKELLGDLLGVCNDCHLFLSGKSTKDPLVILLVASLKENIEKARELSSLFPDLYVAAEKLKFYAEDIRDVEGALWNAIIELNKPLSIAIDVFEWAITEMDNEPSEIEE